ncbi:MAG: DUF4232 domain-containing protein [Solirubrobacteraceae bacterium]
MPAPAKSVAAAVSCLAVVLPGAALASAAPSPGSRAAAVARQCSAAATRAWLGLGLGGGTAGTYYYPLEFSNVGHRTCTLRGYPGVSAYGGGLRQIGPPARRNGERSVTVTLRPGETAHASLGIVDWGAVCSRSVGAAGLKVYPPGQRIAQTIPFAFPACAHAGVLVVGPLLAGVGIPGYTTS